MVFLSKGYFLLTKTQFGLDYIIHMQCTNIGIKTGKGQLVEPATLTILVVGLHMQVLYLLSMELSGGSRRGSQGATEPPFQTRWPGPSSDFVASASKKVFIDILSVTCDVSETTLKSLGPPKTSCVIIDLFQIQFLLL